MPKFFSFKNNREKAKKPLWNISVVAMTESTRDEMVANIYKEILWQHKIASETLQKNNFVFKWVIKLISQSPSGPNKR